jgi:hypothetical protein
VNGKFTGNGKNAAIKFVAVEEHEPFSGKDAVTLIFTEKDPATAKKPSFDAMFGRLGSALVLNVFHDGGIFGCQVMHSAHQKQGFSSIGVINITDFKMTGGQVSGRVSTGKELDTFGEKWEVDLTFAAPLPAKLRTGTSAAPGPASSPAGTGAKGAGTADRSTAVEKPKTETKAAPTGPLISARKLPLPKDAVNVEFQDTVKQIQFTSARPVAAAAAEFSANLKQGGWKESGGSVSSKQSAILRREQGDAKLTIMVQPAGTGSTVKIFNEGWDWSGGGVGGETRPLSPPAKKPGPAPSAEDIEAQAQRILNDALKNLPK